MKTYTIKEVEKIFKIKRDFIHYLIRKGHYIPDIKSRGRGTRHKYTEAELNLIKAFIQAKKIVEELKKALKMKRLKRIF